MRTHRNSDSQYYSYYAVRQDPGNAYNSKLFFLFSVRQELSYGRMQIEFNLNLLTHPGVKKQSTTHPVAKKNQISLEHLLMSKTEQNLFILNANRAGLGSHSK